MAAGHLNPFMPLGGALRGTLPNPSLAQPGVTRALRGASWCNSAGIVVANTLAVEVYCPTAGTIVGVTVIGNAVGSCVIDVQRTTLAGLPANAGNSLCSGVEPALTSDRYLLDTTLAGWTVAVAAGDVLTFELVSCTGLNLVTIQLSIQESA